MNSFLDALKKIDNYTYTENGAVAFKSTGNKVLDAFGALGAMKNASEEDIINMFMPAFFEDKEKAMRLLFYIRDIRGGQGMRRVFRIIVRYLANTYPIYIINNLDNFLFYGRGDDLFYLFDTKCESAMLEYVKLTLMSDLIAVEQNLSCSLLAKWMPSINTSSATTKMLAKKFIKYFNVSEKSYRKMLSTLRAAINIVECKMSANKWEEIDFSTLPAKAQLIYKDAFINHCRDEYINWLKEVAIGNAKVNAASLFPVDIIKKVYELKYSFNSSYSSKKTNLADRYFYDAMWNALPNYLEGISENAICMCDTSGSMSGEPLMVSLALGLYCADKCSGPFKNHFITFDYKPELQEIRGSDILEKVFSIKSINPANTNFEAALQLILDTAISNKLIQEELPTKLYVISDMQFDQATGEKSNRWWDNQTNFIYKPFMQIMKEKFAAAGYIMPAIVYWNVKSSDCGMFHQTVDGEDCCMVSGYSPSLFKAVIEGTEYVAEVNKLTGNIEIKQKLDPISVMNAAIMAERYNRVWF